MLVAQDDPLDQYLVGHPDALFHQPAEDVVIDPTNPYVVGPHLRCAARERPLAEGEAERFFGPAGADAETVLVEAGVLTRRATGLVHDTGAGRPHDDVDVRAGAGAVYRIVRRDTGELIGTADERRAFGTLHAGAIYLHQGEQYLVHALDMGRRVALVDAADPDHTTQARDVTDIAIVGALDERPLGDAGDPVRRRPRDRPGRRVRAAVDRHRRDRRRGAAHDAAGDAHHPRGVVDAPGPAARSRGPHTAHDLAARSTRPNTRRSACSP